MIRFFSREQQQKNIHATPQTHAFRIRKSFTHIYMLNTITTTTNGNHRDADGKEEEDSSKFVTIFVKLLPEPNAEEHKNLTRFQVRDPRARFRFGKTCVFRDVEKKTETVLGVKKRVERETGEKVETLRRGSVRFGSVSSFSRSIDRRECVLSSSSFFFF
jgi:hypothetical protein